MATEAQILEAMFEAASLLGYPVSYPGVAFDPPASGEWLEILFLPNQDIGDPVNANSNNVAQGMFRLVCCDRQNTGALPLYELAETVRQAFAKDTEVGGVFTVRRADKPEVIDYDDGVMRLSVTVAYQATTNV